LLHLNCELSDSRVILTNKLESLYLGSYTNKQFDNESLCGLKNLKSLELHNLSACGHKFNDELFKPLSSLMKLKLWSTHGITAQIFDYLPNLEYFESQYCLFDKKDSNRIRSCCKNIKLKNILIK